MKNMNESQKIWYKFYECSCGGEGIMMSYENEDNGIPSIDMAFFKHGFSDARQPLTFKERCRWCWNIIRKGRPFLDGVMLNQNIAKELAEDLLKFTNKKYEFEVKK